MNSNSLACTQPTGSVGEHVDLSVENLSLRNRAGASENHSAIDLVVCDAAEIYSGPLTRACRRNGFPVSLNTTHADLATERNDLKLIVVGYLA